MMAPVYHPQQPSAAAAPSQPPPAPTFVLQDCDADSAIGDSASPDLQAKSQCSSMSDGEQFECYGENVELELEPESPPRPQNGLSGHEECRSPGGAGLTRHTWLRTSLRRSAPSNQHENLPNRRWGSFRHSGKRLGSNALASQLYRSSSFNSSGRSSTCDTADDMCSDVSLEEDVLDLSHKTCSTHNGVIDPTAEEDLFSMLHVPLEIARHSAMQKVQLLQQQVSVLADNQTNTDDRYTRAKQDSAALQARVHMLEEQLREAELRAEERLQEEQRRHREMMARVDREKELHVENYSIRLQTLELEASSLRDETSRLRSQMERLRSEKAAAEERLAEAEAAAAVLRAEALAVRDAERRAKEDAARDSAANAQLIDEMSRDLEQLRKERGVFNPTDSQHSAHLAELQSELNRLRQENKSLRETNEDLQAQILTRGVEEGRNLLGSGNSIAAELEAMSGEELSGSTLGHLSYEKMRTALKEQQEVNTQLRSYIDGMLLNIVENYPQLLEVKSN